MENVVPIAVNGGRGKYFLPAFLDCIVGGKSQNCTNLTRRTVYWLYDEVPLDKFRWPGEFVWAFEDETIVCRI